MHVHAYAHACSNPLSVVSTDSFFRLLPFALSLLSYPPSLPTGILTGVFATESVTGEGSGIKGCLYGDWQRLGLQVYGCVIVIVWSSVVSFVLLKLIDVTWGLRVAIEDELIGLDIVCHGENLFAIQELPVSHTAQVTVDTHRRTARVCAAMPAATHCRLQRLARDRVCSAG